MAKRDEEPIVEILRPVSILEEFMNTVSVRRNSEAAGAGASPASGTTANGAGGVALVNRRLGVTGVCPVLIFSASRSMNRFNARLLNAPFPPPSLDSWNGSFK